MQLKHLLLSSAALSILAGGIWLGYGLKEPESITRVVKDTQQIEVKIPVLTEKIVDRYITNPKQQALINKLLQENKELKLGTNTIAISTGTNDTGGSGRPVLDADKEPTVGNGNHAYTFRDYQLRARYDSEGKAFDYTLSQSFTVVTSTGRDKDGNSVGLTRVYQDTPMGAKLIPTQSTFLFSDAALPRWIVSPRVQAGLVISQDKQRGGTVLLQWLKHGKSKDPKDLAFAVLSPGVTVDNNGAKFAVAPLSINLGHLPKQPFSNVWVSGLIDSNKKLSIAITATF